MNFSKIFDSFPEIENVRAEISYELSEKYWCRGIMFEALQEVRTLGFNHLGIVRIQAFTGAENIGS